MTHGEQYRLYESLQSFIDLREQLRTEPDTADNRRQIERVQERIEQIAAELYGKNQN